MTSSEEIAIIEQKLKNTFSKKFITKLDVNICNQLLERWKQLTGYVSDKSPVIEQNIEDVNSILDSKPLWQRN